jgi:hypothetical protein
MCSNLFAPRRPFTVLNTQSLLDTGEGLISLRGGTQLPPASLITRARCRQYCSRRLRRIFKGTKFLHGRGRYQKKKLDPNAVKDER